MKKIVMILAIALATFSCSTEDAATQVQAKTVDVALNVTGETTSSTTSKNVNRNNIPAPVKIIKVSSTQGGVTKNYEDFNIVTSGGDTNFVLKDVPTGISNFTAVTESYDQALTLAPEGGNAEAIIERYKAKVPYVIYNGILLNKNILGTGINILNLNMTTQHGRIVTVFQLDDDSTLKSKYRYSIKAELVSSTGTALESKNADRIEGDQKVYFEWSNINSIAGAKVKYTVEVAEKQDDSNKKSYVVEQTIKASTSTHCIYTITKDKAPEPKVVDQTITFTWQQWNNENCPDYPNCK